MPEQPDPGPLAGRLPRVPDLDRDRRALLTRALAVALCLVGGVPAVAGDDAADLGARLDAAVRAATGGAPWGAVLVAREGQPLLAKGYGMADYARTPITPDSLFEIASTSKQFTAAAILRLEREGRLKTEDRLVRFFPKAPAGTRDLTVHHLLTHTAGVDNEVGVPYASPMTRDQAVAFLLAAPVVAKPGERFAYWNGGYALLAAIVEVASGEAFEEYSTKHLFAPAGLKTTGFIRDRRLDPKRATARRNDAGAATTALDWHWSWGYRGMGGVVSTVGDLLLWDRALRGDKILDAKGKAKLYAPARDGYACGWMVETTERGTTKAFHSGGVEGYRALIARYLEEDVVVIVLANDQTDIFAIERAVTALLFAPPKLEAEIRWKPWPLNANQAAFLPATAGWKAERAGADVVLTLADGAHAAATVTMAPGPAKKLAADLGRAIADKGPGAPGGVEAALYLGGYALGEEPLRLAAGLAFVVRPRYEGRGADGKDVVDERATLILEDQGRPGSRGWPVMVKMGVAETRALMAALEAAAK